MEMTFETLKTLWNHWQLRGSVLASLLLQIILICTGNLRKRNSSSLVTFVLWLAYLSADWVATFALGIISNILSHPFSFKNHDPDILYFWTPFLLLHLGGQDTITAFSLEDNQLWLRHALGLLLQLIAVLYIFARSMKESRLVFPTLCVFIAGTLKYGERTWALRCASMDGLRGSMINDAEPGPDYVAIMDNFSSKLNAGKPAKLNAQKESDTAPSSSSHLATGAENENIDDLEVDRIDTAYHSFQTFKRLFVDLILSFKERDASRSIFSRISASQAYKVIEIELNFVYDALYTKALVAYTTLGRIIRVINFLAILTACFYFYSVDKNGFRRVDISVTYLLLFGALALEIVSTGLLIVSDWALVILRNPKYYPHLKWAEWFVLKTLAKFRPVDRHRWSHCMGQYSLLSFCLQDQQTIFVKLLRALNAKELYDRYKFTEYVKVFKDIEEIEMIIFNDLRNKSQNEDDAERYKNYTTCRGERSLQQDEACSQLGWSIDVEFDESLLLWHIATEICYFHQNTDNNKIAQHRKASKLISQYMLYLLIVCPFTLSSTAGLGLIRYGDTCAELINFFKEEGLIGDESGSHNMSFLGKARGIVPQTRLKYACETLLFVHTDIPPKRVKGDRSKSVLWNAVELAKQLKVLDEEKMWKTTCNVWIEMLCFAARHCRGNYHAKLLSEGGELLTFVWFLEAHLGMGEYFQIKSGHITTTIILERS